VVVGSTATLELTPRQAEQIILAQKAGTLTLALRPLTDSLAKGDAEEASEDDESIVVMKHGLTMNYRSK
jgi:pilus assembly protein CpaB